MSKTTLGILESGACIIARDGQARFIVPNVDLASCLRYFIYYRASQKERCQILKNLIVC